MNNRKKIWRIEHREWGENGIGYGPYTILNYLNRHKLWDKYNPAFKALSDLIWRNEPRIYDLKDENRLKDKTLPASYRWTRPGPREDPELRRPFAEKYCGGNPSGPIVVRPDFKFAFDSLEQTERWFHDKEERAALISADFELVQRTISTSSLMVGSTQCLWIFEKGLTLDQKVLDFS